MSKLKKAQKTLDNLEKKIDRLDNSWPKVKRRVERSKDLVLECENAVLKIKSFRMGLDDETKVIEALKGIKACAKLELNSAKLALRKRKKKMKGWLEKQDYLENKVEDLVPRVPQPRKRDNDHP